MWNPFVLLLIWLSELLLRPKCWLFERKIWQEWDSNPGTHSCTRSLKGEFLESGALDRSAILPWVYRTCFILSSITPSWNVESVCLASLLTLRTPASTKMLAFWTQNLTGVGFEPRHTFVYQKPQRRISWVWRLRPLGHPALSISHLLHPVFDNTFLKCGIRLSCFSFDAQNSCFDQNVGFLNAKFDRSGIRTRARIRVPEVSKETCLSLAP